MSLFGTKPTDVNRRPVPERSLAAVSRHRRHSFLSAAASAADHEGSRRPATPHEGRHRDSPVSWRPPEILETDLWQQYNELAGVDAAGSGYLAALSVLDEDMNQHASDNTDDEISHETFLNAYLESKGAPPVNLTRSAPFRAVRRPACRRLGRLTNLMQLTVDTSWWTRYRSQRNPDLGATFPQAIPEPERRAAPGDSAQRRASSAIRTA